MLSKWPEWVKKSLRNPHSYIILLLLVTCFIIHYPELFRLSSPLTSDSLLGLTRYTVGRVFCLVPVIYISYVFGFIPGLVTVSAVLLLMLPRALFISVSPVDALFETGIIFLVGVLANFWFRTRARYIKASVQREQAITAMTTAQEKLRAQIRNTMKREKELTALSELSSLLADSLEMEPPLHSAINMIMEITGVEVILIYNLNEETEELTVVAYEGVTHEFADSLNRKKLGEGFNGRVAETGTPMVVEDASNDPRLTREAVRKEKLQSLLIVPMKSRGRVLGTLCVAVRKKREFTDEEIELLTAIASEIGIAIENARLYRKQSLVMEQLSQSEKHYRALFESAHDAIWVHDLVGNILSANSATEILTGYSSQELSRMNARDFLSSEGLETARDIRRSLLEGEDTPQPYEQPLIRRDGTEATLMLTTNVIYQDGQPTAFENIGRDITEEKRMQENLRSYVQQITQAQEEERLRIARELHDSSAQNLIALLHRLENFLRDQTDLPMEKTRELWAFHEQIKDILQEIRGLSRDLRPSVLDDVGLLSAIQLIIRELKTTYGIDANLQVQGVEQRFPQEIEVLLFRVVQEALRNIEKHAQASNVEVSIRFDDSKTTIMVTDNGIGFQIPAKISDLSRSGKLGLVGMEERVRLLNGSLDVQSEPGMGTSVLVEAPTQPIQATTLD